MSCWIQGWLDLKTKHQIAFDIGWNIIFLCVLILVVLQDLYIHSINLVLYNFLFAVHHIYIASQFLNEWRIRDWLTASFGTSRTCICAALVAMMDALLRRPIDLRSSSLQAVQERHGDLFSLHYSGKAGGNGSPCRPFIISNLLSILWVWSMYSFSFFLFAWHFIVHPSLDSMSCSGWAEVPIPFARPPKHISYHSQRWHCCERKHWNLGRWVNEMWMSHLRKLRKYRLIWLVERCWQLSNLVNQSVWVKGQRSRFKGATLLHTSQFDHLMGVLNTAALPAVIWRTTLRAWNVWWRRMRRIPTWPPVVSSSISIRGWHTLI